MIKAVALLFGMALCVSCARPGPEGLFREGLFRGRSATPAPAPTSPASTAASVSASEIASASALASMSASATALETASASASASAALSASLAGGSAPGASAPASSSASSDALASSPAPAALSGAFVLAPSPAGRTLRVLSFNIREWTRDRDDSGEHFWRKRMEAMRRMIEDVDPDVICLQEVLPPAGSYLPDGYHRVGVGVSHPIYIRDGLKASRHTFAIFWEACTVSGIRIVNVHSRWEKEIVERTVRQVNGQLTGRDIACGDWNTGLRSIESAGLRMQSARTLLGVPETDTFANFTKSESHGAIDHFFVNGLTPVSYLMVTDGYGVSRISDHWPILLDVELPH